MLSYAKVCIKDAFYSIRWCCIDREKCLKLLKGFEATLSYLSSGLKYLRWDFFPVEGQQSSQFFHAWYDSYSPSSTEKNNRKKQHFCDTLFSHYIALFLKKKTN